ncbi:helix-turn-helix domain-containing protein [Hydrogenophaga sp. SNF1]|uniref:helix-turn-helix domain-containing protein n=1 Tax=Hydrogenophaga sp. SNF1 TaxID=3098762 RepID=UPI002ACBF318|nr:helix-turn-helix domain-containing protein [Hydrogenophaga sp. SNF1]WQB82003.1 helix-turn-helix domain-containing protein [Hydrogenophaga sp. SNF1]
MSELGEQTLESAPAASRPVRLSEAREAAGLHIAALAAALKVPVRKLEALEAGRYEELPDLTFARALASSACRQLRIDPAPVLEQIPLNPKPALRDSDSTINAPFKPASEAPAASPLTWLSRPALLGAIALLLAALVVMFLPDMEPADVAQGTPDTAQEAAVPAAPAAAPGLPIFQPSEATPGAPSAPAGEETTGPADTGAASPPPAHLPTAPGAAPSAAAAAPVVVPEAPAAATPPGGAVLQIEARDESWAEVVNGTGTVVLQRLLQRGERVEFSAAPPYAVTIGKASAVQVKLRGRAFDAAGVARNDVARFDAK